MIELPTLIVLLVALALAAVAALKHGQDEHRCTVAYSVHLRYWCYFSFQAFERRVGR